MMVMMMAITPSLNASILGLFISLSSSISSHGGQWVAEAVHYHRFLELSLTASYIA
jgi:hypothetical protein